MNTGLIFGLVFVAVLFVEAVYEIVAKAPLIGAASYYGKYTEESIHKGMPKIGITGLFIAAGFVLSDLALYDVLSKYFSFVGVGIAVAAGITEIILYKKLMVKKSQAEETEEYKDMD